MVIRCVGLISKLLTDPPGALCSPTQLYATWSFNMEASSNQMASLTVFGCSRAFPFCICYETMYKRPDVATVNGRCRRAPLRIESLSGRRMIKDPLIRFCADPTCTRHRDKCHHLPRPDPSSKAHAPARYHATASGLVSSHKHQKANIASSRRSRWPGPGCTFLSPTLVVSCKVSRWRQLSKRGLCTFPCAATLATAPDSEVCAKDDLAQAKVNQPSRLSVSVRMSSCLRRLPRRCASN